MSKLLAIRHEMDCQINPIIGPLMALILKPKHDNTIVGRIDLRSYFGHKKIIKVSVSTSRSQPSCDDIALCLTNSCGWSQIVIFSELASLHHNRNIPMSEQLRYWLVHELTHALDETPWAMRKRTWAMDDKAGIDYYCTPVEFDAFTNEMVYGICRRLQHQQGKTIKDWRTALQKPYLGNVFDSPAHLPSETQRCALAAWVQHDIRQQTDFVRRFKKRLFRQLQTEFTNTDCVCQCA